LQSTKLILPPSFTHGWAGLLVFGLYCLKESEG